MQSSKHLKKKLQKSKSKKSKRKKNTATAVEKQVKKKKKIGKKILSELWAKNMLQILRQDMLI